MAAGPDGSCGSTGRSSDRSSPGFCTAVPLALALASFVLAGCNANQGVDLSPRTTSQVFAGHDVAANPYDPTSYAQNNTGRGGR